MSNSIQKFLLALSLWAILGTPGQAQLPVGSGWSGPKFMDSIIWSEEGDWLHVPALSSQGITLISKEGIRRVLPAPPDSPLNFLSLRKGAIWKTGGRWTQKEHRYFLYRWDLKASPGEWKSVGEIGKSPSLGPPQMMIPLDEPGKYLALSWVLGFADKGKSSYAAIFKGKDEKIEFDSFIDMPFESKDSITRSKALPPLPPDPEHSKDITPNDRYVCEATSPALFPTYWAPIQIQDFVLLGATKPGVLWAFNLKDGHCERVLDLGGVGDKLERIGLADHFLLAIQPSKDKRLLVATCAPDILRLADGFYLPPTSSKEAKAKAKEDFLHVIDDFRTPVWWSIDPSDSWKVTKIDPPAGMPQHAFSNKNLQRFQFIIDPDGMAHSNMDGSSWEGVLNTKTLGKLKDKDPSAETKAAPEQPSVSTPKATSPKAPVVKGSSKLPAGKKQQAAPGDHS